MLKPVFCLWQPEGGPGPADEEDAGKGRKRRQDGHCADESHREGEKETVCDIILIVDATKHKEAAVAEGRVRRPFALPRRSVHTHCNVEGLESSGPQRTGTGLESLKADVPASLMPSAVGGDVVHSTLTKILVLPFGLVC